MSPALVSVFFIACCAGWLATMLVRRIAIKTGFVATPNPLVPQHVHDVAYMGGVGIVAAFAAGYMGWILSGHGLSVEATSLLLPAAGFTIVGLLDDLRPLSPVGKLLAQSVFAMLAVFAGVIAPLTGIAGLDALLAAFWIVFVVNAVNVTDVCDGLVGGLAAIGLLVAGVVESSLVVPAVAAAGGCLGFLVLNAPPAKIFMGDAGSHLLGFLLAALGLYVIKENGIDHAPIALLIVGVSLFEVALLIVMRTRKGLPWWRGSPDHFSLRLQASGLSRWQTDICAWVGASLLGLLALNWHSLGTNVRLTALVAAVLAGLAIGRMLSRWEVRVR